MYSFVFFETLTANKDEVVKNDEIKVIVDAVKSKGSDEHQAQNSPQNIESKNLSTGIACFSITYDTSISSGYIY